MTEGKWRVMPEMMAGALPVLEKLNSQGFEAVFVGGCVRDTIMGLHIHDVDIATAALPEQVMEIFPDSIPTGLQHGTITVRFQNELYEVTTFRTESEYEQHRRPAGVRFIASLEGDLLRRDLTINAMALMADGKLYDPFKGLLDIERRLIRCVGDADARFQEDALRMLRAVRFAAKFSYSFAYRTWRALRSHHHLLRHIAMERVMAELDQMIEGPRPAAAMKLLGASGLLQHTAKPLPALTDIQKNMRWDKLAELKPSLRWAALLAYSGATVGQTETTMESLRFPGRLKASVMAVIRLQLQMKHALAARSYSEENQLRREWTICVLEYGAEAAADWLEILILEESYPDFAMTFKQWLEEMPATVLKQLKIDGHALAQGVKRQPGSWMGSAMKRLLLAVAMQQLPNEPHRLLEQAKLWIAEDMTNDDE
ncbi:CCA tRNA nucleotidyltransferase [Paenibacillus radicis (ex Gao et al. 2016)]|uniref:CCA-adding enzyme n=1 Tax=Paenibacillus radicis (ex Gao et al. 2016) TaxID=1737354 RepID=A0A917GW87_9BACL|nr:CCA tRNA nucleotidyltransferase [Paenibacillus radicis (ex Gao et al. 2016)]GGG58485.1 CCA-adding enzyme [Paenibacillus radicis (ex Gao et al. 2016)]